MKRNGVLPHIEVVAKPTLNQRLIRFGHVGQSPQKDDEYTDRVISEINDAGVAFFSGTT